MTMIDEERDIVEVISENIRRYMKENDVLLTKVCNEVGTQTVRNMIYKNTTNGCSVRSLQKIAKSLGVKTIDLVEDWSEQMFLDGAKFSLYTLILFVLVCGEFKLGDYSVTDNKILKWFLITMYSLGVAAIIIRNSQG